MNLLQSFANLLFPPKCSSCGGTVSHADALCDDCYLKYKIETEETCPACGNMAVKCVCGCSAQTHLLCLAFYKGYRSDSNRISERLVYRLKRKYDKRLTEFFARDLAYRIMLYVNEHNLDKNEFVLTYPPRSEKSFAKYGFDHAEKLTKQISRYTGMKLIRTMKHIGGDEQKMLDREGRAENISASLFPRKNITLAEKSVFLIDDIVTTGATMNRAAELLHNMGARCVIAVSVFRTLPQTRR